MAFANLNPEIITDRFKRAGILLFVFSSSVLGFFNALDGSENALIKIRGLPDYSLELYGFTDLDELEQWEEEEKKLE